VGQRNLGRCGAVVDFEGSLNPSGPVTDASGLAATNYTLGMHAASEVISAVLTDLPADTIEFTVTATPNGTIVGNVSPTSDLMTALETPRGTSPTNTGPGKVEPLSTGALPTQALPASRRSGYVENELIVKLRSSSLAIPEVGSLSYRDPKVARTATSAILDVLDKHEASGRLEVVRALPPTNSALIRVHADDDVDAVSAALRADPLVESVERNALMWLSRGFSPSAQIGLPTNDPL